jgi:hypothetical protein
MEIVGMFRILLVLTILVFYTLDLISADALPVKAPIKGNHNTDKPNRSQTGIPKIHGYFKTRSGGNNITIKRLSENKIGVDLLAYAYYGAPNEHVGEIDDGEASWSQSDHAFVLYTESFDGKRLVPRGCKILIKPVSKDFLKVSASGQPAEFGVSVYPDGDYYRKKGK